MKIVQLRRRNSIKRGEIKEKIQEIRTQKESKQRGEKRKSQTNENLKEVE